MKHIKQFLAAFLAALILLVSIPTPLFAASAPSAPKGLSSSVGTTAITVKWQKVKNASGYVLYEYNSKTKKYNKKATTTNRYRKITNLTAGSTHIYCIKAYRTVKGKKYYSKYSAKHTTSTLPPKVTSLKVTADFTTATLSWKKVNSASSYKVQCTTDKTFKKGIVTKTVKTNAAKFTSLKPQKTYYFRVFAIRTVSNRTFISSGVAVSAKTVDTAHLSTVSESTTYQTFRGFGASACWWAQEVGKWDNADDIMELLYDDEKGIGLDIYRYNVGAGSENDPDVFYWGLQKTQSFVESYDAETMTFTYDWSRDTAAQRCMKIANDFTNGNLQVCLFNNSPPVEITENGKAYCSYNPNATSSTLWYTNLNVDNVPAYVNFVCDVADHFTAEGYNVFHVSPINEPQYSWAEAEPPEGSEHGYVAHEGCHLTPFQCKNFYKQLIKATEGKPYRVSMFEAGAAEGETGEDGEETRFYTYLDNIMNAKENVAYFDEVSVHSYWRGKPSKIRCRALLDDKFHSLNVACTEYCQMDSDLGNGVHEIQQVLQGFERSGLTIDFGVQMARIVNIDLTILNAVEWDWWTACSFGGYADSLVIVDSNDHSHITLPKRYWCMGNYSRFIKPGAVRVDLKEGQKGLFSSAFKNTDGSLAIVYVNQTSQDKTVYVNASGYTNYAVYTTSAQYDLEQTDGGIYRVQNGVTLPSNSVVSVVLTN